MNRMNLGFNIFILSFFCFQANAQNTLNEINISSYDNFEESYNYTYWDTNWKTSGATRSFTNHTSKYALSIDFTGLSINSLLIGDNNNTPSEGFQELNQTTFGSNYSGDINYAILQNGSTVYEKSSSPTGSSAKDSQMAEYGIWCNRRFISTNFTNSAPVEAYYTGIEFANWHNRFKITFHVQPTADINSGQLELEITIPSEYINSYTSGQLYAFATSNNKGFSIKGGENVETIFVNSNTIKVLTTQANLLADESYEVSVLFYAVTDNLSSTYTDIFEEEEEITITTSQTSPVTTTNATVSYSANEGVHYIDVPRYGMGYSDCSTTDVFQNIDMSVSNTESEERRVRLCFRQIPNINVVGFNSILRHANGDPSGLPIQVSKNWHTTTDMLFSGSWIKEYTELVVPANTTLNFNYTRTGAKWGETYSASSHQLSVAGAGIPRGGWLEAALGSFGESVTHSPDYEYGSSNVADVRPFLVTNQNYGGTSTECGWTGNVGGMDLFVYNNAGGTRLYQSQVKTRFHRYSPNLTETSISAVSSDEKLKLDYTFYLNRSDDFNRVYYKIEVEALDDASFSRFDIFQLGGDFYNLLKVQTLVYGNDEGLVAEITPTNDGLNDYTTSEIALTGDNPWVWAGDGIYTQTYGGVAIDANNALIIREYNANFNGVENNTPYFRERSSSQGFSSTTGHNPTSYCIVTPPSVTSFKAGDKIEMLLEVVVLPKQDGDYYGTNINFSDALTEYGNSWKLLYREALGNKITATSSSNVVDTTFPLTVTTIGNTAMLTITGGKGYVPVVFSGLTDITDPKLWKSTNCSSWELVDQSVNGKDYWQADYNSETSTFDLIYNVNQDMEGDATAVIKYYLGESPIEMSIIPRSLIVGGSWSSDTELMVSVDTDSVRFVPRIRQNGTNSAGTNSNWAWSGSNGFTKTGRVVNLYPVTEESLGMYTLTYTNTDGCTTSTDFKVCSSFVTEIVPQSLITGNSWSVDTELLVQLDSDSVRLAPQVTEGGGANSVGVSSYWSWTGPSFFSQTGRVVNLYPVTAEKTGEYTVTYTNVCGSNMSQVFTVNDASSQGARTLDSNDSTPNVMLPVVLYPNPASEQISINQNSLHTRIYNMSGELVLQYDESRNSFDITSLKHGVYFVKFQTVDGLINQSSFMKK